MNLDEISKQVHLCSKCDLYKTKKHYVFGSGSNTAKILFIGEAPGANEDLKGEPFCGRAGAIFDDLLKAIELKREDVYVCNILKCRPPGNRQPLPEEIEKCVPYLDGQIDFIKPKVICPMGNFAVGHIMKRYGLGDRLLGISKLHGRVFEVNNLFDHIVIIPLYHPAVATYNPYMKEMLIEDIKKLDKYK